MFELMKIKSEAKRQAKKEAVKAYRDKLNELNDRRKLLSAKSDFRLLEQLIQKVNDNPELKVNIHLLDGTIIKIGTYAEQSNSVSNWVNYDAIEEVR